MFPNSKLFHGESLCNNNLFSNITKNTINRGEEFGEIIIRLISMITLCTFCNNVQLFEY